MHLLVQTLISLCSRPLVILEWLSGNMHLFILNIIVPDSVEPVLHFSLQNCALPCCFSPPAGSLGKRIVWQSSRSYRVDGETLCINDWLFGTSESLFCLVTAQHLLNIPLFVLSLSSKCSHNSRKIHPLFRG